MSIKRERIVWLIMAMALTATAVTVTNHMRDFNEYRQEAMRAEEKVSSLQGDVDQYKQLNKSQADEITRLKAVPLR